MLHKCYIHWEALLDDTAEDKQRYEHLQPHHAVPPQSARTARLLRVHGLSFYKTNRESFSRRFRATFDDIRYKMFTDSNMQAMFRSLIRDYPLLMLTEDPIRSYIERAFQNDCIEYVNYDLGKRVVYTCGCSGESKRGPGTALKK